MIAVADERLVKVVEGQINSLHLLAGRLEVLEERVNGPRPSETGFASGGAFLAAIRDAHRYHQENPRLRLVNAVAGYGSEGVGADGGYALPADWRREVLQPVIGAGSLLGMFDPLITNSNLVVVPKDDESEWSQSGVTVADTDEGGTIAASKPAMKKANVILYKTAGLVHASEELDDDLGEAFASYIWRRLLTKLRYRIEWKILLGTGQDEPLGVLNGPGVVTVTANPGGPTVSVADVENMASRLLPGSFPTSFWVLHSSALPSVMGLALYNGDGRGPYGTLVGRPVLVSEACSPVGTAGDIALVDPGGFFYAVKGPRNVAVMDFAFDQGLKSFRSSIWMGGVPLLSAPVARRTGGDTLSHCVTLGRS